MLRVELSHVGFLWFATNHLEVGIWVCRFQHKFQNKQLCQNDQAYHHHALSFCILYLASCIMHHVSCIMLHGSSDVILDPMSYPILNPILNQIYNPIFSQIFNCILNQILNPIINPILDPIFDPLLNLNIKPNI